MDQTRKGQFNFRSTGIKIEWNRMELEWKWNGNFTRKYIDAKQNGNGIGNKWSLPPGSKIEWSRIETERKWSGEIMVKGDINIWFWKRNGME